VVSSCRLFVSDFHQSAIFWSISEWTSL
jgi:hypothetical protein